MKIFIIDVDGTLTDGSIIYDENENELKKFSVRDAAGFFVAKEVGIKTMVLTGRECKATQRRMGDLKVDYLFQNIKNKKKFLQKFCKEHQLQKNDLGYIGDDLNDLEAMKMCGFVACPSDACIEVRELSNYVSDIRGGYGAVRDVIEHYLRAKGLWDETVSKVYQKIGT